MMYVISVIAHLSLLSIVPARDVQRIWNEMNPILAKETCLSHNGQLWDGSYDGCDISVPMAGAAQLPSTSAFPHH